MKKIFLINGHQPYPFSEGRLNRTLFERAQSDLEQAGCEVRTTISADGYDVAKEIEKHRWADVVILQTPVNWMGVTWSFKKYMDEVYSAGMGGELCNGDGRSSTDPKKNYGAGGTLDGRKYMLSLTFNAPAEAFDDDEEYLFKGKSVDDLMFPMHMNFRFFAMQSLPTFSVHDVMKNAVEETEFERYREHLRKHILEAA